MKIPVLLFSTLLAACATNNKKFEQEKVKGEANTWLVKAYEVPCSDDVKECHENVRKIIGARGSKICKKKIFAVHHCDFNPSSNSTILASCTLKCGERATRKKSVMRSSPKEDDGSDPNDFDHPFDWN